MDLTETIAPKSDQLNADDLMAGPRTVTIAEVTAGDAEQPVKVHLVEFPDRPFKPSKSMRRVMVAAWGKDSTAYTGRRMTLYRDPKVRFGGQDVGGIRVSHMTDLPGGKPLVLPLTVTRGKREAYRVEPLTGQAPAAAPAPRTAPAQVTREQVARLQRALAALGIDQAAAPAVIADELKCPVTALRDLTAEQVDRAADALERMAGGAA